MPPFLLRCVSSAAAIVPDSYPETMPLEQMDFPATYDALRPVVEHEYFDHRAVPQLEEYLDEQASECRVLGLVDLRGYREVVLGGFCLV